MPGVAIGVASVSRPWGAQQQGMIISSPYLIILSAEEHAELLSARTAPVECRHCRTLR
jgi:hypothetical protein